MKNTLEIDSQRIFDDDATIRDLKNFAINTKEVIGFEVHFEVTVTNTKKDSKCFLIIFETEARNHGLIEYTGYEMYPESVFDESQELLEFADYDETLLYDLETIAEKECKEYLNKHSEGNYNK